MSNFSFFTQQAQNQGPTRSSPWDIVVWNLIHMYNF